MAVYSSRDKEMVLARYRSRISVYGLTEDSLKSGSIEKQVARHDAHASVIKIENPSILDIGCGMGHLSQYLSSIGIAHSYNGYDIVPEYIEYCKKKYTDGNFELRNVFDEGIDKKYDYIILSQVLNNRFQQSDNLLVMKEMIRMCYENASLGVSIDMMSAYVDFQSDELYYYSPEDIFSFSRQLSNRVLLKHDYRPYEFCIQLFKPEVPGFVN